MLTPLLDPRSNRPLYEQIYRYIRSEIEGGRLNTGERLPSKRSLASHLRVGVITIEGAYGQLLAEGYIRSEPKRGFFVQTIDAPPPSIAPSVVQIIPISEKEKHFTYEFATTGVDTALFPFSTWARLMREVLSGQEEVLLAAAHRQGAPQLRRAIADYLYRFRGIRADPEQVVVGAGSEYLIGLLVQLLGRDAGYGVETPGYPKTGRILASCGGTVIPLPLDEQGLCVDKLEQSGAQVAHVTPSHHFPLGIVMPVARRQALLDWATTEAGRYIIEDDYDSEFRFSGRPIPALQSLDTGERVVYLNTFAKSLAPSLRISYMVLPPHLLERYRRELWFYACTVPSFEQYTLALFMERGHFERHIARTRNRYRARRDVLLSSARGVGLTHFGSFSGADAGLHLLLQMHKGDEGELTALAAAAGVGLTPLSAYDLAPPPARLPTLILGYTRLSNEDIPKAIARLSQAWSF